MSKELLLICIMLLAAPAFFSAQPQSPLFLKRATEAITIDGQLNEASWFLGSPAKDFWQNFPSDSIRMPDELQTEIYMTFDDKHLYIAAICHTPGNNYVVPSLRRDYRFGGNDNLTFLLDPFRDRTNAFVFGMNPYGVMREALIANGGNNNDAWNGGWDNKWRGESHIGDNFWSCELAIPFSTLRYQEGEQEWFFNCYRGDTQSNTTSTWNRIPQNQIIMSLAFMGGMIWEEPPGKPGANISIIPYVSADYNQDYEEGKPAAYDFNFGGDAKIAITPSLNLDLTVDPDFSQVEVDEQVLNLDRFEIFFPERRQFFLENADLFGAFGDSRINPFFSRRIGVTRDTSTGQNIQNTILGGARLSGKLDENWRLGVLNMQTARDRENGLPSFNYTVAALQRKVFSRSNIGLIFVNKQTFADENEFDTQEINPFNRVIGLDYNLASSDNRWTGKAFYHRSFSPEQEEEAFSHGARLEYRIRPFRAEYQQSWVGAGYNAEVGFVPRTNFFRSSPEVQFYFYPGRGALNQHSFGADFDFLWTPGFGKTDHQVQLYWDAEFSNTADARITLQNEYIYLLEDFDPTRTDAEPLPGLQGYSYWSLSTSYSSDRRRILSYELRPTVGQFFNGYRYGLRGGLTYRYQPYGSIEFNFNYNHIDLPTASTDLFLIGPRIDLTFSKNLFLTTFIQYNNQIDNVNINARLQWRFAPVSDFFLVYTDNFNALDFSVKQRALVMKVTYWLNL